MARKIPTAQLPEEEIYQEDQELLPPTAVAPDGTTANELDLKAQRYEEQLLDLKRQQDEIARQKRDLDELSRKQREFDEGRREIVEKLTRGLVLLEREEFEVKRELEQIKSVRDNFSEHLSQTENINPADWASEELPSELTKALARVDQAKSIYSQSRARLLALRQGESGAIQEDELGTELPPLTSGGVAEEKSFGAMLRESFAYSIVPFMMMVVIGLIAYVLLHK
jgi:predicted RNase H-like nuclease (RuvC/YqgF family)